MADPTQIATPVVYSPLLLNMPVEVLDNILAECYKHVLLKRCPHLDWYTTLDLPTEQVCKMLRQLSIAMRKLQKQRSFTVENYIAFAAMLAVPAFVPRCSWLCRSMVSLTIHHDNSYRSRPLDWQILLPLCPQLKTIYIKVNSWEECFKAKHLHYMPLDTVEAQRKFARAVVQDDVNVGGARSTVCRQLLNPLVEALHQGDKQGDINYNIEVDTWMVDKHDQDICTVITKYVWRETQMPEHCNANAFVASRKCVVGEVEEMAEFDVADAKDVPWHLL